MHSAEYLSNGFQQVFGHARALQYQPHEREERDGQQQLAGDDAEYAQRQYAHQCGRYHVQQDAGHGEQGAARHEREHDGNTG